MLPIALLVTAILGGLLAAIALGGVMLNARFARRHLQATLTLAIVGVVMLSGGAGVLGGCGSYIAGQGDGATAATEWAARYRPGWTVGECQPRDTDRNDYITCTLVPSEQGGDPEPIECGVNRWYHGYGVSGCKQLIYARGRK